MVRLSNLAPLYAPGKGTAPISNSLRHCPQQLLSSGPALSHQIKGEAQMAPRTDSGVHDASSASPSLFIRFQFESRYSGWVSRLAGDTSLQSSISPSQEGIIAWPSYYVAIRLGRYRPVQGNSLLWTRYRPVTGQSRFLQITASALRHLAGADRCCTFRDCNAVF